MHHIKYRFKIGASSQHGYPLDDKHFVLKYMAGNEMTTPAFMTYFGK
jgi:hypothetical protein